jgi:hypothetical protein
MRKLFIIIGVLAISASASADSHLEVTARYHSQKKHVQTMKQFRYHWIKDGKCSVIERGETKGHGVMLCVWPNGSGVLARFNPRLVTFAFVQTGYEACENLRNHALNRHEHPHIVYGRLVWRWDEGPRVFGFAGINTSLPNRCLYSVRDFKDVKE